VTYCPVCDTDPCELDELRAELKYVPYKTVDQSQVAAQKARIRWIIRRVERTHKKPPPVFAEPIESVVSTANTRGQA